MKWQICDHLCLTGQGGKSAAGSKKKKWFYLPRPGGVEEAAPAWPWALAVFVHSLGTVSCWSPEGTNPLPPQDISDLGACHCHRHEPGVCRGTDCLAEACPVPRRMSSPKIGCFDEEMQTHSVLGALGRLFP